MTIEISCTKAQQNLANLLVTVVQNREIVIIHRRDGKLAALIAAEELVSLMEIAHLLRSPANARRLLKALNRASKGGGVAKIDKDFAHQVNDVIDTYRSALERLAKDDS